jgi:hypothetical protein
MRSKLSELKQFHLAEQTALQEQDELEIQELQERLDEILHQQELFFQWNFRFSKMRNYNEEE